MKTARPSTTGWLSLSETEDELESLSSVYTVTQGDDGTGAGGVGWSEAEAGRYLGKRCGSLRDMTTFVFCQQSGDQRAKSIPLEAARRIGWNCCDALGGKGAGPLDPFFEQKTGF